MDGAAIATTRLHKKMRNKKAETDSEQTLITGTMPETTQHTAEALAVCSGNTIIQAATAPLYITTAADAVAVLGSALRVKTVRQLHQAVPGTVVKAAMRHGFHRMHLRIIRIITVTAVTAAAAAELAAQVVSGGQVQLAQAELADTADAAAKAEMAASSFITEE